MKNRLLFAALLLGVVMMSYNVLALSTEQRNSENTDGTAKFADPDEQMPAFVISSDHTSSAGSSLSFGDSQVTPPTVGDSDYGARDFDRAYAHLQQKE